MRRNLSLLALLLCTTAAHAQVRQSGTVTPGHAVMWTAPGIIQDAGTAAAGKLTTLGITNNGGIALAINSGATTGAYQQLGFIVSNTGSAHITLQNYGGATPQSLSFLINGTEYPLVGNAVLGTVCAANTWVSTIAAITGEGTCTRPSAANLSNGTTGTGLVVLATAPTLSSLTLSGSTITSSTYNGLTITSNGTNTFNLAAGKTLKVDNTLEFTGTDSTIMTLPTTSQSLAGLGVANTWSALQTFSGSAALLDTGTINWNGDTYLIRDLAVDTLAMQRGTNPQNLHLYNTFTSGSNYERATFDWSTNVNYLTIGTTHGASGSNRPMRFTVGAVSAWDITTGLNLQPATDAVSDLGTSSFRPRDLTISRNAVVGGTVNKVTITTPATGSTLTIADGKVLTASNTLTFTGTDASSVAFGTGGTIGTVGYSTPGQIPGAANNTPASAGNIGEFISSVVLVGSAVSLTTATDTNITSVSLTAGDWQVCGEAWYTAAGGTTSTSHSAWISATSATAPSTPATTTPRQLSQATYGAGLTPIISTGCGRQLLAGTTTVYLSTAATFAVSTLAAYGVLRAWRER